MTHDERIRATIEAVGGAATQRRSGRTERDVVEPALAALVAGKTVVAWVATEGDALDIADRVLEGLQGRGVSTEIADHEMRCGGGRLRFIVGNLSIPPSDADVVLIDHAVTDGGR